MLIAYQLWFMGIPLLAEALNLDIITRESARLIVLDCQNLRKKRYRGQALRDLSKDHDIKKLAHVMLKLHNNEDLLILSLLARYFKSENGIPSRLLIMFIARPFHRLNNVIATLYYSPDHSPIVKKTWNSLEGFGKSFKNVLACIESRTFREVPMLFLHA